jgi:UDP-2,3-diacylglucosamine hydrolase
MRALFISDIHIHAPDDPSLRLLYRLLDACPEKGVTHLFFVGDIFDFWIADRKFLINSYQPLIERIRKLVDSGVRVHYFEGNHDLDLKRFWHNSLGVSVHSGAAFFNVGTTLVRVEHGDQMDPKDRGYLFLRWLLRTPVVRTLARYLPEIAVRSIGARASTASRQYTTKVKVKSDEDVRDTIRKHARWAYAHKPFDIFVSGHVHIPEDSTQAVGEGTFRCINLGTWLKQPLVLDVQGPNAALRNVDEFLHLKAKNA